LFVSHSMASMLSLTSRCILLSDGRVAKEGPSQDVVAYYQRAFVEDTLGQSDLTGTEHYGTGKGRFVSIKLRATDAEGSPIAVPTTGCDLQFELRIDATERFRDATIGLTIYDESGFRIIDASSIARGEALTLAPGERATVLFRLRGALLRGGTYSVGLWLGITNQEDFDGVRHATSFRMEHRPEDTRYSPPFPGVYLCSFDYRSSVGTRDTA